MKPRAVEALSKLERLIEADQAVSQEVVENDLQTDPENHLHPAPPQHPYYHSLPPAVMTVSYTHLTLPTSDLV